MVQIISRFLNRFFSPEFVVFLVSLLPLLELRGGMIAAALFDIPWYTALIISAAGNALSVYFAIAYIKGFLKRIKRIIPLRFIAGWIEGKGVRQGALLSKEYPARIYLGLMLFVAVPLPGTGAWTGALIASVLGLELKKSRLFICLGVIIAGLFMSVVVYIAPILFKKVLT